MAADIHKNIVIVGGGMMGCSTAYHLTSLGASCTLIERSSIACAASGKAGGFLARNWCDGTASGPLARASYELHKIYGAEFDCDYRPVDSLETDVTVGRTRNGGLVSAPKWIDKKCVLRTSAIGDITNTAQVHPGKLCQSFINRAQEKGCKVIIAEVIGVEFSPEDDSIIQGVQLADGRNIECDTLIVTMGPWTNVASQWFDHRLPVIGTERAHSIVVTPKLPLSADVLFLSYTNTDGSMHTEIYPRPDGTVYLCGFNDNVPLPENTDLITPNKESLRKLQLMGEHVSSNLEGCEIEIGQACYLPLPPQTEPVIGMIPYYKGRLYMAAGHYCWGILNGPATGKGLAELIVNGHSTIDLSAFEPKNFH